MTLADQHAAMTQRIIDETLADLRAEADLDELNSRVYEVGDQAVEASRAARLQRVQEAHEAMRWARMRMRRGWAR